MVLDLLVEVGFQRFDILPKGLDGKAFIEILANFACNLSRQRLYVESLLEHRRENHAAHSGRV
jgi:hypothetical protein